MSIGGLLSYAYAATRNFLVDFVRDPPGAIKDRYQRGKTETYRQYILKRDAFINVLDATGEELVPAHAARLDFPCWARTLTSESRCATALATVSGGAESYFAVSSLSQTCPACSVLSSAHACVGFCAVAPLLCSLPSYALVHCTGRHMGWRAMTAAAVLLFVAFIARVGAVIVFADGKTVADEGVALSRASADCQPQECWLSAVPRGDEDPDER